MHVYMYRPEKAVDWPYLLILSYWQLALRYPQYYHVFSPSLPPSIPSSFEAKWIWLSPSDLFSSNLTTSRLVWDEFLCPDGFKYIFLNHFPPILIILQDSKLTNEAFGMSPVSLGQPCRRHKIFRTLTRKPLSMSPQEVRVSSSCSLHLQATGEHVLFGVSSLFLFRRMIYFQEFKWLSYRMIFQECFGYVGTS